MAARKLVTAIWWQAGWTALVLGCIAAVATRGEWGGQPALAGLLAILVSEVRRPSDDR